MRADNFCFHVFAASLLSIVVALSGCERMMTSRTTRLIKEADWKAAQASYEKSLALWDGWKQLGSSSIYDRERRGSAARLVAYAARNIKGSSR